MITFQIVAFRLYYAPASGQTEIVCQAVSQTNSLLDLFLYRCRVCRRRPLAHSAARPIPERA